MMATQKLTYCAINVYTIGDQNPAQLDTSFGAVVEQFVAGHCSIDIQIDLF